MMISTYAHPQNIPSLDGAAATVIDTLRMTSTAVTALSNGCREIRPVAEVEEALEIARKTPHDPPLLCGERGGLPIAGFALSNSPLEYTREAVAGKKLITTTTNGTRAILAAASASFLYLGSLLNARAVAEKLASSKRDVALVCAGTLGRFSMEDTLTAGAIIDRLLPLLSSAPIMDDLSQAALGLFRLYQEDLHAPMQSIAHYQHLRKAGYEADLRYCLRVDVLSTVPYWNEGVLV